VLLKARSGMCQSDSTINYIVRNITHTGLSGHMVPYTKDIGLQVFRHNLRHDVHACERVFFLVLLILCTEVMDRKLVVTGRADRIIPNLWTASWLRFYSGCNRPLFRPTQCVWAGAWINSRQQGRFHRIGDLGVVRKSPCYPKGHRTKRGSVPVLGAVAWGVRCRWPYSTTVSWDTFPDIRRMTGVTGIL